MAVFRRFLRIFCGAIFALSVVFVSQNAFAVSCSTGTAGQYKITKYCYSCPHGCYCSGQDANGLDSSGNGKVDIYESDVIAWCNSGTACPWTAGSGQCGQSNAAHIYRCPRSHPNSAASATAQTKCYKTTSLAAGKYLDAIGSVLDCPRNYYCPSRTSFNAYYGKTYNNNQCPKSGYSYITKDGQSLGSTNTDDSNWTGTKTVNTKSSQITECYRYKNVSKLPGCTAGEVRQFFTNTTIKQQELGGTVVHTLVTSSYGGNLTIGTALKAANGYYVNGTQCSACAANAQQPSHGSSVTYCTCKTGYSGGGGTSNPSGSNCVANTYTVHFDMNGATAKSDITVNVPNGNTVDIGASAPTRSGWSFGGWQISGMQSGITHQYSSNNSTWYSFGTTATANRSHSRYWKNLRNTSGTVTFKARWYKHCLAGTYFRDSDNTCQTCPSGYYCHDTNGYDGEGDSNNKYACPSGFTSDTGARTGGECYKTGTTTCATAFPVSVAANATSVQYANNGTVPCKYYSEYDDAEGYYTTTQSSCIPDAGVCEVVGMNCNAGYTSVETASPLQDAYSENSYIDYVEFEPDGSVEWNNSNWYREGKANGEWDTWFDYGVVRGRSLCTIDSTSIGDFDGGEWNVTQSSVGQHCWCQTTLYNEEGNNTATWEPAISSWYYAGDMNTNEYCAVECSYRCAVDIIGDNGENFRSDLYDSTVSYECQPSTIHCNAGTYLPQNSTSCTTCPATFYCPGGNYVFNTTSDQGKTACPTPNSSTQRALTADDFDATLNNFAIQPWTTGIQSIDRCMANYSYTNSRGLFFRESVKYNPNNGKYDNGGLKYYTSINAGYYADTHIRETYCDTPTNSMLYQNALECLNGSYCPGVPSRNAWPLCSSGTYTDTNIIYTCPAGYDGSDNGRNTNTDCYKNCPTITVQHATNVTPVNSKVYYNGSAYPTCTYNATCDTGYTPSGNGTATPTCTANTYSISYNLNDGSFGTNHPKSATYDVAFTVNNPTHEHATFAGWNITGMDSVTHTYGTATTTDTSIKSTTATNFKNLRATSDESVIFTAKWNCATGYTGDTCRASSYTITYNLNSGAGCSNTTYTFGNTVTLCTPTRDGYIFNGWYDNANLTGTAVATIPTGSTGNKTYWAKWTQVKFQLTTTSMTANDTFKWSMSAAGTFYVDCGDNGVLSGTSVSGNTITRSNTTMAQYTCTYPNAGTHTIRFGGTATEYNNTTGGSSASAVAIGFSTSNYSNNTPTKIAGISGSLGAIFGTIGTGDTLSKQPRFFYTFDGCSRLTGAIPSNLFAGISGAPATSMFNRTFSGCGGLTGSIPESLFAGISGAPAASMFANTFDGCSGLTGAIPSNLFAGIKGTPAPYMFSGTFFGCSGLTGSIPEKLFAGISGKPAASMFRNTLYNCSGLTGAIPENLFAGISGAPATYMFSNTFYNCSGLTGAIPESLFVGIKGAPANNMFASTFYGCSKLTGFTDGTNTVNYVPGNFLGTIKAATASNQVYQMFQNTGLASTCPSGTTNTTRSQFSNAGKPWCGASYTITYNLNNGAFPVDVVVPTSYITEMTPKALPTPVRDGYNFVGWSNNTKFTGETITEIPAGSTGNKEFWAIWFNASCPADYFMPSDHPEMCFPHVLHIGDNTVYLKSEKQTTPSLNISIGNDVFYANMTTTPTPTNSATEHNLKMIYNNTVYYVCDDTTCSQQ